MLKTMSVMDAWLLAMESPETPMHVGGVQILRLPPGAGRDYVAKLREALRSQPVSGAPFNYLYRASGAIPGIPAWELLDRVDLDRHVFHHALPWPGGERELFELVSRLNAGLLDRSRPLWENHLIEGLAGRRYATFTRIHHALIDGKWGMKLAEATTSPDPAVRGLPPYWAARFDDEPQAARRAGGGQARQQATQLPGARMLHDGIETVAELRKAFGRMLESFRRRDDDGLVPYYTAPECIINGPLTARRDLDVARLDLTRIKALAKASESTVNEIVLALCGGALRAYLLERNALPARPLIANMPIAVARPEGTRGGNAIVPGMVSLATHLEQPLERLKTIRGSSQHAKELVRDLPSNTALAIFMGVTGMPYLVAQAFGQAERVHAQNLVISNVPGLREHRYVNGARIEAEFPMSVLVPGEGMNITVISRADVLDVAVLVCPDIAPEARSVGRRIAEALNELEGAVAGRDRPARARASAAGGRTARKTGARRAAAKNVRAARPAAKPARGRGR